MTLAHSPEIPSGELGGGPSASPPSAEDRFRWHPEARLFGSSGLIEPVSPAPQQVIAETPATMALCTGLATAALGLAFRIGGGNGPPDRHAHPTFETLTSGSSGKPRRILRSQASWIASFEVNARMLGIGPGTKVAILGQLVQSLALYGALEAIHLGAEMHLLCDLRPDRQNAALRFRMITHLYASPAQMRQLLNVASEPVPSVRCLMVGGSKLDPVTRQALAVRFPGAEIREFYGAAETSFISLSDPTTPEGSVGRAYPGVEIRLADASETLGNSGQIWVRSPFLFQGYAGDPGRAEWQNGWLSVGEVGRIEAGCLYIHGRADRMVTIADQNVFPEEIEAFLLTLPDVTRAAVIARPDSRRGHVIDAVVEGGTDASILSQCRATLGPLKTPRNIHRVRNWPLLVSGKTDLAALVRAIR